MKIHFDILSRRSNTWNLNLLLPTHKTFGKKMAKLKSSSITVFYSLILKQKSEATLHKVCGYLLSIRTVCLGCDICTTAHQLWPQTSLRWSVPCGIPPVPFWWAATVHHTQHRYGNATTYGKLLINQETTFTNSKLFKVAQLCCEHHATWLPDAKGCLSLKPSTRSSCHTSTKQPAARSRSRKLCSAETGRRDVLVLLSLEHGGTLRPRRTGSLLTGGSCGNGEFVR